MRTKLTFDKLHSIHRVQNSGDFATQTQLQLPPHYRHHAPPPSTAAPTMVWKSAVPKLYGGLAAMLGLIAFALLILVCSDLKLFGNSDSAGENEGGDDGGDENVAAAEKAAATVVANSRLVIMAGEDTPTFLAIPVTAVRPVMGGGGGGVENPQCSCSCSCSFSMAESEFEVNGS